MTSRYLTQIQMYWYQKSPFNFFSDNLFNRKQIVV